jgi:alpha-L-rhamnosidase
MTRHPSVRIAVAAATLMLLGIAGVRSDAAAESTIGIEQLRCEYLRDPLGLGTPVPRLGWNLTSPRRGEKQTAYQILVASSADLLRNDRGDLWDSGKVQSDETAQVEYGGKALASRQACFWKVRSWDRDGKASDWSNPARWEMGLLQPGDWSAKWIDAKPIGTAVTEPIEIFSARYESDDGKDFKDVTAIVKDHLHDSTMELKVTNDTMSGDPANGKHKRLAVEYEQRGQKAKAWANEGATLSLSSQPSAVPYLRRAFRIDKPIARARLYITALGLYEVRINGEKVGDHVLAPDWTDYGKRVEYQVYDVTGRVKQGANALGVLVANGWYSGHIGNGGFQKWGKIPALCAQLEITFDDGTVERVVTDETWKAHRSPLVSTDFMLGESYDAREELSGWDQPSLDASKWEAVTVRSAPTIALDAQIAEPVRQTGEVAARSVKEVSPGRWVFDMGQNMVGVVRVTIPGKAGTTITLRHAEMVNKDGTLYTENLRRAPSVDTYASRGTDGDEIWQPRFTFHGFRYVELSGMEKPPALEAVRGIVIGSDIPMVGQFSCSDQSLNQLQSNIQWGLRGNYVSVPTDCPQRDERLGWMGDAQVFVRTATYNADVAAFFTKWLVDVDDAQAADGRFTDVSPAAGAKAGTPAWGDAGVICPWTIYQAYGDKRLLERHLPAMIKWIEWCREHSTNLIRDKDRGGDYGDWLSIGANTPKDLIGTAYFAYSTHLVAKAAAALGKKEEAAKYEKLFRDIKAAFNEQYVSADGRIQGDTQCLYAMALKFELLPDELRAKAAQYLEDDIKAKEWHLSTGFVGVGYLLPVLTHAGKLDTAYQLMMQDTFPSWLFSVKQGATTIWERWDGWTPDKGFQDPKMNSFNHYSLGSCGEWMFGTIGGIQLDPEQPGFEHIIIRPRLGGGLSSASVEYRSIQGEIKSKWEIKDGKMTLNVSVPTNTTATVYVPGRKSDIREGGKLASEAEGVRSSRDDRDAAVFEVGSGDYSFASPLPR